MTFAHRDGNRTAGERLYDLEKVSSYYIRGMTPSQIAKRLSLEEDKKITTRMVGHDLELIKEKWLNSAMVNYDVAKSREVAHIDEVERAAWEGWARSIRDQVTATSEDIDDAFGKLPDGEEDTESTESNEGAEEFLDQVEKRVNAMMEGNGANGEKGRKSNPGSTYSRRKVVSKSVTQVGSARFLQVIQWCIDQRCKIYGLHQPEKFQIDWKTRAIEAGLSESEANNQFASMVATWADVLEEKEKENDRNNLPNNFNDPNDLDSADGYPE